MKWSVQQLRKLPTSPYPISETFDFQDDIKDIDDILSIEPTRVEGTVSMLDFDRFKFNLRIKTKLVLACALTLEPIEYPIDLDYSEIYSTVESEDALPIQGNTVNLRDMVWTTIIVNKPIRVVRDDAYEILAKRNIILNEELPDDE